MSDALRVLVVEDDHALRELYLDLLGADGHLVRAAADGREALTQLTGDLDLIISDINMPNMNGREFLQAMRAIERLHDVPVLVITAFPEDLPRALAGPNVSVLRKPFEIDVFSKFVDATAASRARGHDA